MPLQQIVKQVFSITAVMPLRQILKREKNDYNNKDAVTTNSQPRDLIVNISTTNSEARVPFLFITHGMPYKL